MIQAVISAIANAFEVVTSKIIISDDNVGFRAFTSLSMVFVFMFTLVPFFFIGQFDTSKLNGFYGILLATLCLVAFGYNLLYFYSLSAEEVCDVEPFALLHYPVAILFAAAIFPSERNWPVLAFALVACTVLILSRIEKKHLVLNRYFFAMMGFVVLIAIESSLVKELLNVFSPAALYSLRTGVVAVFLMIFLSPNLSKLRKAQVLKVSANSILTVINYVFAYYAISKIGVVKSSLIFLLGPILVLLFSKLWLKENLTFKKVLADLVIIMCVAGMLFLT